MNKTTRLKKPQVPKLDEIIKFDDIGGRPKYGGVEMTSETDVPAYSTIQQDIADAVAGEATLRTQADNALSTRIDDIEASSDVVDVVGTYADLLAYDTSKLGNDDIVKVLSDETRNNQITYYRWKKATSTWVFVGALGPYYTETQVDTLLGGKEAKTLTGAGAPTLATAASNVGQQYYDATNDALYFCSGITGAGYVWEKVAKDQVQADWLETDSMSPAYIKTPVAYGQRKGSLIASISKGQQTTISGVDYHVPLNISLYAIGSSTASVGGEFALAKDQYDVTSISGNFGYAYKIKTMGGAHGNVDGSEGLVPAPTASDLGKYLKSDGTWDIPNGTSYTAGTNISISSQNVISAIDTTYSAFVGATSSVAGSAGLVPAPTVSDPDKFLKGDGTWGTPAGASYSAGTNITITNNTINGVPTMTSTEWTALWA